jgi:hypothetical protein
MTPNAAPPEWAERVLQAFLTSRSFESVSGDLLEEYRETIFPARGRHGADVWYLKQIIGYAWRSAGAWATLFAGAFLVRAAIDWRMPTTDFHLRSTVSTLIALGIFLVAGFWAGARTGSMRTGAIVGLVSASLAVPLQFIGTALLIALWHDPATLSAIRGSGGLAEEFTMPILTVLPCALISAVGGMFGALMCAPKPSRTG